jgi:hypothetical protein
MGPGVRRDDTGESLVPYGIGPPGPAWLFVLLACMERARTAEHRSSDENSLEFSWPHLAWVNDAA